MRLGRGAELNPYEPSGFGRARGSTVVVWGHAGQTNIPRLLAWKRSAFLTVWRGFAWKEVYHEARDQRIQTGLAAMEGGRGLIVSLG